MRPPAANAAACIKELGPTEGLAGTKDFFGIVRDLFKVFMVIFGEIAREACCCWLGEGLETGNASDGAVESAGELEVAIDCVPPGLKIQCRLLFVHKPNSRRTN